MNRHLSLILFLFPALVHAADDEQGMAAQLGPKSWASCAGFLSRPQAKVYELSQLRSPTMPLSPFAGPYQMRPKATASIPGTNHAFNSETFNENAEPGQQGTQIDALGHFGVRGRPWDGKSPVEEEKITYYGGLPQSEVKPTPDSPLLKLGMEKAPPLITSAVLLDAKGFIGRGAALTAGMLVTAKDIQAMLKVQGLEKRGIRAGDIVYVHTGWGERWQDPDRDKTYYSMAPGLSYDAARYLAGRKVVAIGLDTPFIDPVPEGMLAGKAGPAAGVPPGLPFAVHHHMITQAGIHHIENAKLDEMARDKVWLSCTIVLPLREKGAAGSAVRPVAIGAPAGAAGRAKK
jgi:kynurenine formamidase